MRALMIAAAALFAAAATPTAAQVVERHADGFTLRYTETTPVGRGDVAMAIQAVGAWWDGDHTYSGVASNMTLDLRVGGCLCETMPDGSTFEHGRVTTFDDDQLVLEAPLGPLKGRATRATLTFDWPEGLALTRDETHVVMTFVVEGPGLGAFAEPVGQVMGHQHARLVRLIQTGAPESPAGD